MPVNNDQPDEKNEIPKPLTHAARNREQVILLSTYRIPPPFNANTKEEYDPPLSSLMSQNDEFDT